MMFWGVSKEMKNQKRKKSKGNKNAVNNIKDNNNNSIDNCDDISIVSVADSILDAFKNDVINETEFNTGNKIIPQLSCEFFKKFN